MQEHDPESAGEPRGPSSFCIPKAALAALIENKASAYEICAYLTLARYTEVTGRLSPASVKAVNTATGGNKTTIERAIARLQTMRVRRQGLQIGKKSAPVIDCGPIVWSRDAWSNHTGEILPDGPVDRAKIRYILPNFDEPLEERVWFGAGLVSGINGFLPLKELKNAGDIAARLLLLLYQANAMDAWGGIDPHEGPWERYEPVANDVHLRGDARLIRSKRAGTVASGGQNSIFGRAWGERVSADWWDKHKEAGSPCWRALEALQSSGLIYEMVMVLNRDAKKQHFAGGEEYSSIPQEAEPYYELDCRSQHGYKPAGEEGIGSATARTAGDCGSPIATEGGRLDGTYAAIVPRGYGAMIAGIFRLRFRVANPKNVGVKDAWSRIGDNNRSAFERVQRIRQANKLDLLPVAWGAERKITKVIIEPETSPA